MNKCPRCKIASYCDDICKNQDWNNHKSMCKKISYLQDLIPKIERNFYDFNLILINPPPPRVMAKMTEAMNLIPDDEYELGPQNLFETRYKSMQFLFTLISNIPTAVTRKVHTPSQEERRFLYSKHLSKEFLEQMIPHLKALI